MIKKEKRKGKTVYVLYTSSGDRILGIHPTNQKALKQEYAIRMSKKRAREKD